MSCTFLNSGEEEEEEQEEEQQQQCKGFSSSVHFKGFKTVGEFTALFRNKNLQDPDEDDDFNKRQETEDAGKYEEQDEIKWGAMNNNFMKNGLVQKVVLTLFLCLLLLNFVLVVIVMNRTSSTASSSSSSESLSAANFFAQMNQTQELETTGIEEEWKSFKNELFVNISENSNLLRKLQSKTNQMDSDTQKFRRKAGPLVKNFVYGDSSSEEQLVLKSCVGVSSLSKATILQYSQSSPSSSSCAWLTEMTSIKLRLIDLEGEITIYTNLQTDGHWASSLKLTWRNLFEEKSISSNIALLVFSPTLSPSRLLSPSSPPGFEIELKPESTISGNPIFSMVSDVNPLVTKQLPSSNGYGNNERRFYIAYPPLEQKVKLNLESVETEATHDSLYIFKFGNESSPQIFQLVGTYSGSRTLEESFTSQVNQPIIMYLVTDSSQTGRGFTANISSVDI